MADIESKGIVDGGILADMDWYVMSHFRLRRRAYSVKPKQS